MDSGNSGSLNSSSGGDDDEYDSRTEPISAFFNSSNQQPPLPPPPLTPHNHQPSSTFDQPLSNLYFDPFSLSSPAPTPNSLLNLDMVWPKNLMGLSSSSSSTSQPQYGSGRIHFPNPPPPSSSISLQPAAGHENGARKGTTSLDHHQTTAPGPNPKKRSRASRRAPTTVLTTNTSNFRAMVQEFTGIPASPFSAASSALFPRSRFDLFNTSSTMKSGHLETAPPAPPYLLRPHPHKVQLPSFSNSIITTNATTSNSNSTSTTNYQLHSDHQIGLSKEPHQNLPNIHLPFQSHLLEPDHHQPATNLPIFVDKSKEPVSTISSNDSQLKIGHVFEEFSMNNHGVLSNVVTNTTSNEMSLRNDNISPNKWGNEDHHHQSHLRSFMATTNI